jgi:hypothetical protein
MRGKGARYDERYHSLKEKDDDINEDQAGHRQAENLQIFTDDIMLNSPVVLKASSKVLSIFVGSDQEFRSTRPPVSKEIPLPFDQK